MKIISWTQTLAAAGKSEQWFRSIRRRKQVALAWGVKEDFPRGIYCDVDAAGLRLTADLASGLGPTKSAAIMRLHGDAWLEAVALADVESSPVFLVYIETGWGRGYNIVPTVVHPQDTYPASLGDNIPTRMLWLNVTATLQNIRANAKRIGLDLSGSFLPPPGDPLYEKLVREKRLGRERALAIVRGQADIAAAPSSAS